MNYLFKGIIIIKIILKWKRFTIIILFAKIQLQNFIITKVTMNLDKIIFTKNNAVSLCAHLLITFAKVVLKMPWNSTLLHFHSKISESLQFS